jgi:hypothetical protein
MALFCFFAPLTGVFAQDAAPTAAPTAPTEPAVIIEPPKLGVPIPDLQLGSVLAPKTGMMEIPFLAQYIAGVARYLMGISVIAAAIMIVYGGFLYIVGSTGIQVQQGKGIIVDAIVGLLLLLGSYTILQTINPELLTLKSLNVPTIKPREEGWLAANGGGDPIASIAALEESARNPAPGTPIADEKYESVEAEMTELNKKFDASLGGPANLNIYCPTKADAEKATNYEQKIQLLAKAVLGWHNVCVENHLCVYCQGCFTSIPGGSISTNPNADYVVKQLERTISMRDMFTTREYKPECSEAYDKNPKSLYAMPECTALAKTWFDDYITSKFLANKLFAGDCGSFSWGFYQVCVKAKWKEPGKEKVWNPITKKTVENPYLSYKSLGKFDDDPTFVLGAHLDADINALAAKKGGMKFGDMIYMSGGAGTLASHWILYTGGRGDVPFSFIEMGGVGSRGANVPGLGQTAGVRTHPKGMTIQDYVNLKIKPQPGYWKGTITKPSYDAKNGIIFVWRPYAD